MSSAGATDPIPVPFAQYSTEVPERFVDYNGHMNDAAYAQVLTDANEVFLDWLGLSADYRSRTGCAMFTVEMSIRFRAEAKLGEHLTAESVVASHDAKRLRLSTTVLGPDDVVVAEGETLYLHVDAEGSGRVSAFPEDRVAWLTAVSDAQATQGDPTHQPETSAR